MKFGVMLHAAKLWYSLHVIGLYLPRKPWIKAVSRIIAGLSALNLCNQQLL